MEDLLLDVGKVAPIVAVLVYGMWWLKTRIEAKEEEIKGLNAQLRESEKTALQAFSTISDVLKTMSQDQTMSNKDVVNELKSLRDWLNIKLDK